MKHTIAMLLALCLCIGLLAGCGSTAAQETSASAPQEAASST